MTFTVQATAQLLRFAAETSEQFDPDRVSPGVGGFLAIALMAVAVALLGFDLVRRLRRSRFRHEIRAELEAELAERQAAQAAAAGVGDAAAHEDRGAQTGPAQAGDAHPRPADPRPGDDREQ